MNQNLLRKEWHELLKDQWSRPYMTILSQKLNEGYQKGVLLPAPELIFRAFNLTPPEEVKVVILGQDPYHNGHAHGLAFSSLSQTTPASLRTIFKEIYRDIYGNVYGERGLNGFSECFRTNDLTCWARQGVLLINSILTVMPGEAKTCRGWGWEEFTKAVLARLANKEGIIFVLWGKDALNLFDEATGSITIDSRRVLTAGHPATASYGKDLFSGCRHFSQINQLLQTPIEWRTWKVDESSTN